MAWLDRGLKQRMVGAAVLSALAVIFLPMLFTREDVVRQVVVEAPPMPNVPPAPHVEQTPVVVPEPEILPEEQQSSKAVTDKTAGAGMAAKVAETSQSAALAEARAAEARAAQARAAQARAEEAKAAQLKAAEAKAAQAKAAQAKAAEASRLDANSLPVSWSVQLASLSNTANAQALQRTLRSQGYNAYIRRADGMNRVYVGPVIDRAEASRLRDQLKRQHGLSGFLVRFQPERG